jgi:hypothetical protein
VGCWVQDDAGVVQVRLLEQVSARARRALDAEAARLTSWLGGFRVPAAYLSPAMAAGGGQVTGSSTVIRESAPRP